MVDRVKKYTRVVLKRLLIASLIVVSVGSGTVFAAANEGPIHINNNGAPLIRNSGTYGNPAPTGRYWDYVVSYDDYTDILETDVLVYSPIPNPVLQIIGRDLCVNNSPGMRAGDVTYAPARPAGTAANNYRVFTYNRAGGDIAMDIDYGRWNYGTAATCRATTATLNASGSPFDPNIGMYVYRINAIANTAISGKFANSFHIVAPAGSIVTQSSRAPFSDFGMQSAYPNPTSPAPYYSEIDIPFGPDCTLTTQTDTKSIFLMDPDNGSPTQPDVQPNPMAVAVLRFTRSTGVYRGTAPLTWVDIGNGFAQHEGGNIWRPLGSNQTAVRFDFTVDKDEIYFLRLYRVYYNNTLQFRLPYDGGYYYRPCLTNTPRHVRAVTSMTPNPVENGQQLTGTTSIINSSNNAFPSTVDFTRRVWADRNRNNVFDAGDTSLLGPQSGTTVVPASPGTRPVVPNWTATADSGTMGGRVCISLGISAAAPVVVDPPPISISCADIGKRPHLQIKSGDAMVGGTFRNVSGVCPMPPAGVKLFGAPPTTIGAAVYSSFADFGIFSLGEIRDFGANGVAPGAATLANNVTYGNTPVPRGYFYSSGSVATGSPLQARCLNDPFAVFSPRATANNASTTIDVATLGADTVATAGGTITLTSSQPLPANYRRVIYAPNATQVTVSQNIQYADGPFGSINEIPQLVVLANQKMMVNGSVTRMDGLYAAKGDFVTCEVAPRLNTCNQPLTLNGALVVGGNVLPLRTAGSQQPNYGDMAEIFRLSPDVLLNQVPGAGGQTYIRTIDEREVPARF